MSERRAYDFAFKLGAAGSIIIALIGTVAPLLPSLVALWLWLLVMLFVLPRLYIYCTQNGIHFEGWKGPHQ